MRAKINYLDKEEKPTTFFFQTEKCRAAKHTLKTLKTADGKQATTTAELLEQSRVFYADLFTEEAIDLSLADYFCRDLPTLSAEAVEICEGLITFEECTQAITQMKDNKTPGSDGLTKEFYAQYFLIL